MRGLGYALLGSPVEHSVSPAIHRAAFARLGVDARYEAVRVRADQLENAMRTWAERGGGNVTLPHKARAADLLDAPREAVRATAACNCFWRDSSTGGLAGDNTDVGGFLAALGELPRFDGPSGARVLLLGAGGAARAVLHALLQAGAARVDVANRTASRARELLLRFGTGRDAGRVGVVPFGPPPEAPYDLVVNATSLGLRLSDPLPLRLDGGAVGAVLDLVYGFDGTRWTQHARALGIPAADGLGMLVHQAALSIRRWLPGVEPPLGEMQEAARRALEDAQASGPRSAIESGSRPSLDSPSRPAPGCRPLESG